MDFLTLRAVTDADAVMLYRWQCDVETTRFSYERLQPITWDEHLAWFITHRETEHWYIGMHGDEPIGTVRIDPYSADGGPWVSIVVDQKRRGNGYGEAMLKLLPGDTGPLLARIHRLNAPSIAVFEKVGFAVAHAEGNWLVFRR